MPAVYSSDDFELSHAFSSACLHADVVIPFSSFCNRLLSFWGMTEAQIDLPDQSEMRCL